MGQASTPKKKSTRARVDGKAGLTLDELRSSRPELFAEFREPREDRSPSIPTAPKGHAGPIARATMTIEYLLQCRAVLESPDANPIVIEEAVRAIDEAHAAANDIGKSLMPGARIVFMRAIDTAVRCGDGVRDVLQLFGSVYPELASKCSEAKVAAAILAWTAENKKWIAAKAAIAMFDDGCPEVDRLARAWREAGGESFTKKLGRRK